MSWYDECTLSYEEFENILRFLEIHKTTMRKQSFSDRFCLKVLNGLISGLKSWLYDEVREQ